MIQNKWTAVLMGATFLLNVPLVSEQFIAIKALARVSPTEGNKVKGLVTFEKLENGSVLIAADFEGLTPGLHGFHVHEHGDCSSKDGSSAGGHFNPMHKKHGGPDDEERHAGDFGNVNADASGKAHYERIDTVIELEGENSIIDKSIVIHADPDDLKTDPSGNSGKRIGCGPIEIFR
ncbi:MAG TPA: superoxide dismutase family protein [Parachlamydiaceae bacterium]|nr:superoxide dismutase family protein [Parachlamydiaceae bacterium]